MSMQGRIVWCTKRHQQGIYNIMYKVEEGCEQQTEVTAQANETFFWIKSSKACLQSQDIK
jgi:hypothetical protein